MLLNDVLDYGLLLRMREEGYVREQVHPDFNNLRILNYTEKAQFDNRWNEVTMVCRGLIYDADTAKIVARPFRKFFNYGQAQCPEIDMDAPAVVMDKMDGSLGILYQQPDSKYAIATRGSFSSDQAVHATKLLNEKYSSWLKNSSELLKQYTPLFEIIYPENRIVCDYKGMDDLILLDMVEVETGDSWGALTAYETLQWPGFMTVEFEYENMAEALAASPRKGAEGYVVLFPETGERVKIKQEDYIALHRIVTGLNARSVWQHAKNDGTLYDLLSKLPDEFHEWVREVWDGLFAEYNNIISAVSSNYLKISSKIIEETSNPDTRSREFRKNFALTIKDHPYKGYLFQWHDDKVPWDSIWESLKPAGNVTPSGRTFTEDNT